MNAEIKTALSRDAALSLFEDNCCCSVDGYDVIPEYRMLELFGECVAREVDRAAAHCKPLDNKYIALNPPDRDVSDEAHAAIRLFYRTGFLYIVGLHNYAVLCAQHAKSSARATIDTTWAERCKRLEAADKATLASSKQRKTRKKTGNNTPAAATVSPQ